MATRELTSVDVLERDDLDRLLDELPGLADLPITLDIATESDALTTAAEFEELAAAAKAAGARLSITTDDPLRQELALIYGLSVTSSPDAATSILHRRDLQTTVVRRAEVVKPGSASGPEPLGVQLPRPESHRLLAPRGGAVLDPDASFSFVVAPPSERRLRFSETADFQLPARGRTRRRQKSPATGLALSASALVVASIVIAAAIIVLLIGLLAPSATVVLIPERQAITSQVTYGVATEGASLDVTVEPVVVSTVLNHEATRPATGERQVPDAKARGMIFLTNPLSRPVEIPAGTTVTSLDGTRAFLTTETIEVPAADPFGAATFGTAVVDVEAIEPGPGGNLGTGELAGELGSGILYQNRFPLEGGTTRAETYVTEDDLEALARDAEQELRARVDGALDGELESGWLLLGSPETPGDVNLSYSAEAGAVADEVSIRAELRVEGRAYDPAELERLAKSELERRLSAATPEGFSLLLDSVRHSQPESAGSPVSYVMRSEATIQAYIDPALESQLADALTGKSEGSARRLLDGIEGLAGYRLSYGPDWLPWEPVPQFANRVSVDIDVS